LFNGGEFHLSFEVQLEQMLSAHSRIDPAEVVNVSEVLQLLFVHQRVPRTTASIRTIAVVDLETRHLHVSGLPVAVGKV